MKHRMLTLLSVLLIFALLFCCGACGKDTSGLGTLDLGDSSSDGTLAPLGGSDNSESEPDAPDTRDIPEPTPTPEEDDSEPTESEPDSDSGTEFVVDEYSCADFDCYIPQGWNVDYKVVDAGGGVVRIYIFVQDPTDANNILFYVSGMEPYFTSSSEKDTFASVAGSGYEWAPVLNELSAAGVLEQWASGYTLMDATGFDDAVKYFNNYSLVSVLYSETAEGSDLESTTSQVLAEVTIPGASGTYGFLLADTLSQQYLSNIGVTYYVSYDNMGFCLSADRFDAEMQGLIYCVNSLDLSKFKQNYGSSIGITAADSDTARPEITLPEAQFFADN